MFVDKARVKIKAGNGGDGAISFHREKYINAGGPDGGNGGKGGDVIFIADDKFSSLIEFRYKNKYIADEGDSGGNKNCSGRNAEDLIVKVPRGTLIRDANTGRLIADISSSEPQIIAHGGKGGKGNAHFATPTRQIPQFSKPGFPGESFDIKLELKLIADVGLVGFPNVGKSTLISVVSAAKPKIANYHFTTLSPVLGVVSVGDSTDATSFVMADIPGLIEGAGEGIGLGHEFLRHVERCRLIVHIVDVSGSEGRDPIEDFKVISHELSVFNEELANRPIIVAANKSDMATDEQIAEFKAFIDEKGIPFFEISAATTQGTKELVQGISQHLVKLPPIKEYTPEPIAQAELDDMLGKNKKFDILVEDGIYYIEAEWLRHIMRTVKMDDYESLQYFQRVLRNSGIIDELEKLGVKEGDTVDIFGFEFEFTF